MRAPFRRLVDFFRFVAEPEIGRDLWVFRDDTGTFRHSISLRMIKLWENREKTVAKLLSACGDGSFPRRRGRRLITMGKRTRRIMADLNQFAISKVLGSKIKQLGPVGFGNFLSLSTTEEIQRALQEDGRSLEPPAFGYQQDAVVVQAFEDVRDGAPTDELLWNKDLARSPVRRCGELSLNAPHSYLVRRLINVRKNSPRYQEHGIVIQATSKKETHPSIVPEYAHVIEFALVKLRYRYGSSIDDILMDESLGDKFEELAHQIAPSISSRDLRLGALYIRKNRVMKKKDFEKLKSLDLAVMESAWKGAVSLSNVIPEDIPVSPGLIELKEDDRYLYISHNWNIQSAVRQLGTGDAFRFMASSFWKPKLDAITLCFTAGQKVGGIAIETWERKLIHDLDPVFNWPMPRSAA